MVTSNPRVRIFVGIPQDPDGTFDRDRLQAALHHGLHVVRWQLDDPVTA